MKPLLLTIALILPIVVFGQFKKNQSEAKPVIENDYVKIIGASATEFADWAKEKDKWYPINVEANPEPDEAWWDKRYIMTGEKFVIDRSPSFNRYTYIFKDNRLIQINVNPIKPAVVHDELKRLYDYIESSEKDGVIRTTYHDKSKTFKIVVREQRVDTGFESSIALKNIGVALLSEE